MVLGTGESGSLVLKPPVVARLAEVGVLVADALVVSVGHVSTSCWVIELGGGRSGRVRGKVFWEEMGLCRVHRDEV